MPRQKRQESPTGYYHVMMRGINKDKIFLGEDFKAIFKSIIKTKLKDFSVELTAYCVMDNHVHLAMKGNIEEISNLMQKTNAAFAIKLNKKMDRIGYVFQDRFKSKEILGEEHLLQVVRYIHNNPLNVGIANRSEKYKWSSYNEYISGNLELVSPEQYSLIVDMFDSKDTFIDYHKFEDEVEHLDTKEEIEEIRQNRAQKIIKDFCVTNGITDAKQLIKNPEIMDSMINELMNKTNLSLRKIGEIVGLRDRKSVV